MDRSTFDAADPIVDRVSEMVERVLGSDQLAAVRDALAQLSKVLGPDHSVNLNVTVEVFDTERAHPLPLLTTGMSTSGGEPPYVTWGDSTPQRYVVDGEIQVVPHDRCPRCYGPWDFKFETMSCRGCGARLGDDVRVLLDTDVCPHCEEGHVSASAPVCDQCGYRVDPGLVVWG
jgi:hypothetical protein